MNKLWNMGKYIQMSLSSLSPHEISGFAVSGQPLTYAELCTLPLSERAIIHNVHILVYKMTQKIEEFALGEAGQLAYEFIW